MRYLKLYEDFSSDKNTATFNDILCRFGRFDM